MRCVICDTSAALHELVDGKCLKCLHLENTTLRLMMAHVLMAIDTGPQTIGDPAWRLYKPEFTQSFVDHLRSVLGGVNTQSTQDTKYSDGLYPPIKELRVCKHCGSRIFQPWSGSDNPGLSGWRHISADGIGYTYLCPDRPGTCAEP